MLRFGTIEPQRKIEKKLHETPDTASIKSIKSSPVISATDLPKICQSVSPTPIGLTPGFLSDAFILFQNSTFVILHCSTVLHNIFPNNDTPSRKVQLDVPNRIKKSKQWLASELDGA